MTAQELGSLLASLPQLRIGVIGDYCLDVYWEIEPSASETSIETGLATRPVRRQRYALGGAGTIVNNLLAMGVGSVAAFGVVGNDPFGLGLVQLARNMKIGSQGLLRQTENWDTMAYVKAIENGNETNRVDLGGFNHLSDATARELIQLIEKSLSDLDAIILNDQFQQGVHSPFFRLGLNSLMKLQPDRLFVVDCRHTNAAYPDAIHRVNEAEAKRLGGTAAELCQRWNKTVFVSRGARGCVVAEPKLEVRDVPAVKVEGPIDIVGAGDSMLAGITVGLAAGRSSLQAAEFGTLVASVTIRKLLETGTASPDEIRQAHAQSTV